MKRVVVTNIQWDGGDATLPRRVVIDHPSAAMCAEVEANGFADEVAEQLTADHGFCVAGFDAVVEEVMGQ